MRDALPSPIPGAADTGRIKVIWGSSDLPADLRGAVVAMGTFDGVHKGHQAVIAQAAEAAANLQAPLAVITFNPLPKAYFRPGQPASRLMRVSQQAQALEALGVQMLYVLAMDELSHLTAEEFARTVLRDALQVRHVAVGFDNTFGRDRAGGPEALAAYGRKLGFGVSVAAEVADANGQKISSTSVRDALREGRPDIAASILGRPFAIQGAPKRDTRPDRPDGFPTATVDLGDYAAPRLGTYATKTRLADGREFTGVASVGDRRTKDGLSQPFLEVSLSELGGDICDQVVETELLAFLRPEEKFESLEAWARQLMRDAARARMHFQPRQNPASPKAKTHLKLVAPDSRYG